MCNLYRLHRGADAIRQLFAEQGTQLSFPEGAPNLEPKDIRITDPAPIVRMGPAGPEMVVRRWSWPGGHGKPLYNLKSDGRNFPRDRAIALADGFYEYTAPDDPRSKRKKRWLFTPTGSELLGIAAIWRANAEVGEAFTLLTAEPGADVAPYHRRQIVLLGPA
ncbi:MAG TPA: SOS response-associated peptidase family protein, partial [Sphingomicrobium sp.]|nr:SOS response-associated peptidase family protein [Sphingomicrobium sp.]